MSLLMIFSRKTFFLLLLIICLNFVEIQSNHHFNNDSHSISIPSTNLPLNSTIRSLSSTIAPHSTTTTKSHLLSSSSTTIKSPIKGDLSPKSLVDQFNHFRHLEILSRIRKCPSDLTLNEVCESYFIDNRTNTLNRSSIVQFQSLEHVAYSLIDRITVQKLRNFCLPGHWCLGNLTKDDIQYSMKMIQQRGESFCALNQCHRHLVALTNSCPSISNKNFSIPTLRLLPMLCRLYEHRHHWNNTSCMHSLAYLFHLSYAFWSQLEACSARITGGSDACTAECRGFEDTIQQVEKHCPTHRSFLTPVSSLSWYQTINLKDTCEEKNLSSPTKFIHSMKSFFTSNVLGYRFHQSPIYIISFVAIVVAFIISISLCFHVRSSRRRLNATGRRRSNDNYEYTRLHNASFELGTTTEISHFNSTSDEMMDETDSFSMCDYQRLLHHQS